MSSLRELQDATLAELDQQLSHLPETIKKTENKIAIPEASLQDIEPWPHPIVPHALLDEIALTLQRFIVCPPTTAYAATLWIAMTWFIDVVQVAPLAIITAPEKRCGKSQLLAFLSRLVQKPLISSNITPAALFRTIDAWQPTLLIDEADAFMRENEELRGLLNCGHTRDSAYTVRVVLVGKEYTPQKFFVWGAKALAGIGHLADTLMDRAIVLELRRKLPHEKAIRLRHAETGLFERLAAQLARFKQDYAEKIQIIRPELPEALNDRVQDNWEPLLAIAEVAGGEWPHLARTAALTLSKSEEPSLSLGAELLADIQTIFQTKGVQRISSIELTNALCTAEESSWTTYHRGKPLTAKQLSRKLKEFGISSKNIRFGHGPLKGYEVKDFEDAFHRYLSDVQPIVSSPATSLQPSHGAAIQRFSSATSSDVLRIENPMKALSSMPCSVVADKNPIPSERKVHLL